jgi:hypothetical protein
VDLKYVFDIIETAPDNIRLKSPGERSQPVTAAGVSERRWME